MLRIVFAELQYIRNYILAGLATVPLFTLFITKYVALKGAQKVDPELIYFIIFWAIVVSISTVVIPLAGKTTEKRQRVLILTPLSGIQLGLARLLPIVMGTSIFLLIWIATIVVLQIDEAAVSAVWVAVSTYCIWMCIFMEGYFFALVAHKSATHKRIATILARGILVLILFSFILQHFPNAIFGVEISGILFMKLFLTPSGALGMMCLTVVLFLIALFMLKGRMSYLEFPGFNYNPILGRPRSGA